MGMLRATPSWSSSPGGLEEAQLVTAPARCGMGKVPEVTEGLLLHDVEQGVVVEIELGARRAPRLSRARASGHSGAVLLCSWALSPPLPTLP